MLNLFFGLVALLTLVSAFGVVWCRNAVNGAMCLILSLLGVASLFALMEAYFLAVIQVLVYAGAVVVLFLFIIMLINPGEDQKPAATTSQVAAALGFVVLAAGVFHIFVPASLEPPGAPPVFEGGPPAASSKAFGVELFTKYMLPFQVAGFLLLLAVVGVINLSKRPPKPEEEGEAPAPTTAPTPAPKDTAAGD